MGLRYSSIMVGLLYVGKCVLGSIILKARIQGTLDQMNSWLKTSLMLEGSDMSNIAARRMSSISPTDHLRSHPLDRLVSQRAAVPGASFLDRGKSFWFTGLACARGIATRITSIQKTIRYDACESIAL